MNGKISPWFSKNTKPVREGCYEIKNKYGRYFAYYWINNTVSAWHASGGALLNWEAQQAKWRGIIK